MLPNPWNFYYYEKGLSIVLWDGESSLILYVLRIYDFKLQTLIDYIVKSIMKMEFFIISIARMKNIACISLHKQLLR